MVRVCVCVCVCVCVGLCFFCPLSHCHNDTENRVSYCIAVGERSIGITGRDESGGGGEGPPLSSLRVSPSLRPPCFVRCHGHSRAPPLPLFVSPSPPLSLPVPPQFSGPWQVESFALRLGRRERRNHTTPVCRRPHFSCPASNTPLYGRVLVLVTFWEMYAGLFFFSFLFLLICLFGIWLLFLKETCCCPYKSLKH